MLIHTHKDYNVTIKLGNAIAIERKRAKLVMINIEATTTNKQIDFCINMTT